MTASRAARTGSAAPPSECWYTVAASADVGRNLLAARVVDHALVIFRTSAGVAVALDDRCAHRPYPLSAGSLDGDLLRCGLCGFAYDAAGRCVSVPTQSRVPMGAAVPAH